MVKRINLIIISILIIIISVLCIGCNSKKPVVNKEVTEPVHSEKAIGEDIEEPAPWNSNDN